METADLILAIAVPLVAMLAGWVGVEMSLTPAEKLSDSQRRNYRAVFVVLMMVAIGLNIWQTARNAKQQENARLATIQKDSENTQRQSQLSNKVSEQGGKLDAIAHFEQQFLTFVQQKPESGDKAYEAMATAVLRLAQGSSPAAASPPGGRLEILYNGTPLNGQNITVPNQPNGQFQLAAFHTKNAGTRTTGPVSVRIYFNRSVITQNGFWQPTDSEESGYPVSFWLGGPMGVNGINPSEVWNWMPFLGLYPNWPQGEAIAARVKFFYGTDKPAVADFVIHH